MPSDIQTMMFRMSGAADLSGSLHRVSMPDHWGQIFREAWPSPNEREGRRIPYASLGDSLRLLFPSIAHVSRMNRDLSEAPWLLSWERPGSDQFMALIRTWVRTEVRNGDSDSIVSNLEWGDLDWSTQELRSGQHQHYDNGSPKLDSIQFDHLPDLVCAELAGREVIVDGRPVTFRRAYEGRQPCLLSWPATESTRGRSSWYWSYVLTPKVLTSPGSQDPILSIPTSVRKWASRSLRSTNGYYNLPFGENTTVYVEIPSRWFSDAPHDRGHSLVGLQMQLRSNNEDGAGRSKPNWVNSVKRILNRVAAEPRLPDASELAEDPARFLNRELGSMGITLRSSDTTHPVTAGVPLSDRRDLFGSVAELLQSSGFSPLEVSRRVTVRAHRGSPLRMNRYADTLGSDVVQSVRQAVGIPIRFEVWYQSESTRDAIRNEIWDRIAQGAKDTLPTSDRMTVDGTDIEVQFRELGSLGSELGSNSGAADRRVREISEAIGAAESPVACMVELHGQEHFTGRKNSDPKGALRRGLAATGRLSQFVTPLSADDQGGNERVKNGFADLLRQMGNLPGSPLDRMHTRSGFPSNLQVLAVWVHRKNGLPVLVHLASPEQADSGADPIGVMLPTGRATGEWYSYPEALLRIGGGEIQDIPRTRVRGVLKKMLSEFADTSFVKDVPMLMLCDAINLRSGVWPELQNQVLDLEGAGDVPWNTAGLKPRLARVNANDNELPQWFGVDGESDDSLPWSSGLFKTQVSNVYYSVAPKSTTMKSSSHRSSKQARPFDNHALTRAKEIVLVQLHEGDNPDEWANAVHRMREMASHYDGALELPLPLHLAVQTEEYIPISRDRRRRSRRS